MLALARKSGVQSGIFKNKTRIEVIQLLLNYEILSLSEICKKLNETYNRKLTLPGLLRHMQQLENVGIVRQESGGFLPIPDARRRVYMIQGKTRVEYMLQSWSELDKKLRASMTFNELTKIARHVLSTGSIPQSHERKTLGALLTKCESPEVFCHLTGDEKKKLKFWRMMLATTRELSVE